MSRALFKYLSLPSLQSHLTQPFFGSLIGRRLQCPSMLNFFSRFNMSNYIEQAVCKTSELQVNEKKLVPFGNEKILLIRESNDKFAAIGSACSHYGAPLINGVLYKSHISCPWHGACFNIHTGDIEDFPGCDSIPVYETYIKDDSVYVKAHKDSIVKKRVKAVCKRNIVNRSCIVIIGAGPAGFQCAETLRQNNFDGRIVMITSEDVGPYDRTKLSKSLTVDVNSILLRNEEYYKNANIELIVKTHCTKLDTQSNIVHLDNGSNLSYDKLFIGTGSSPRKYDSSLENATNVYYLRTYHDANKIAASAQDKNVVLIGSSFIVMEIASYLCGKSKSISVVSRSQAPFANTLGDQIGERIKKLSISKNINFYVTPKANFCVEDNQLRKVKFDSTELDADICVIGIGSEPNTKFLHDSGIQLNKSFIEVNEQFQTSVPNVYAGGDVVLYPNSLYNQQMNVAHWQTAQSHGRYAALAMINKKTSFQSVPFFWSMLFGKGIRFSGTIEDPQNCIVEGNLEELSFVAYYFNKKNHVIGVATMSNDPIATAFASLIRDNGTLTKQQIENEGFKWVEDIMN